ncbi:ISHde2 transposase orfA [Candidatus Regiella insecticola]|uniref:ISHde2 transposase orfA n=1 Tax=Candidatus Regiella insecticola TaxID=138073 RepID=A0A6L2ZQX1_9ENTR|nr:ISHde2 transposase orfA [Candidatus Regiella insecticola]
MLYVLRTGIPWRDVPTFYGHWHTIYTHFKRCSENGLFWHLLYLLQKKKKLRFDKLDVTFFSFFAIACLKVFKLLC